MFNNDFMSNPQAREYENYLKSYYAQSPDPRMYSPPNYNQPPPITNHAGFLKGRPVVSLEEARAAQIDLDGSLYVFTDLANQKIYTKQINLEGIAELKTYSLVDNVNANQNDYVTKSELNQILNNFKQNLVIQDTRERGSDKYDTINERQLGSNQTTVSTKPSF